MIEKLKDEIRLAALYAEFADEDRKLAEEGLSDYNEGLTKEDILLIVKRGEIWLADLNPIRGSEQAGVRFTVSFSVMAMILAERRAT